MSGPIKISEVMGNSQLLDGGAMFGNAPRAMWEQWHKPDEQGRIKLMCRAMLVSISGKLILCEAGIGAFFDPQLKTRFGVIETEHCLIKNLRELGYSDNDIDFVILSHLHFDHAGGILPSFEDQQAGKADLLFPNARYVVGQKNFERSQHPHPRDRASFIEGLADRLRHSGRLIIVPDGQKYTEQLPPEVSFFYSDGHTPGQMHTIVKGKKRSIIFLGDLVPGASWVHVPITMGYDRFPELVIDEKKLLYQTMGATEWVGFFTHDPELAAAKITQDTRGRFVVSEKYSRMQSWEL